MAIYACLLIMMYVVLIDVKDGLTYEYNVAYRKFWEMRIVAPIPKSTCSMIGLFPILETSSAKRGVTLEKIYIKDGIF